MTNAINIQAAKAKMVRADIFKKISLFAAILSCVAVSVCM